MVLYLCDIRTQVQQVTLFGLADVHKVQHFLLADKVGLPRRVLLAHQRLSSQQHAVARHDIAFMQDYDISWDQTV